MKISPLFKWFGSKWQSAKNYPPPMHDTIIEPFAGSAGYALNYCNWKVSLWEDDPNIFNLWTWLIETATQALILEIPIDIPIGTDIRTLGLNRGQALLLKNWQRTNNASDCWTVSPWGNLPGQWTAGTRARVAESIYAVKHWKIEKPILRIDEPATWFIDPPYYYNYRYSGKLPKFDYDALDSFVQTISRESLVIVCEAVRPKDGCIPTYLPFRHSHESVTSRRKMTQSHHSKELVYIRKPRT